MKNTKKCFWCIIATITLIAVFAIVIILFKVTDQNRLPLQFTIKNANTSETEEISVFDAKDGNYYVFLPSYATMSDLEVEPISGKEIYLNNKLLTSSDNFASYKLETPYKFSVKKQDNGTLWFYRSANVATMYINTRSGTMENIHNDKTHKESTSIRLYSANGKLNFSDTNSSIKGRGNSSWFFDKHPYSLTLSKQGDLLNMGSSKDWILLANARDVTNLHNKIIYDLASQINFKWSPKCEWVDLYANGEYKGLYLLTEKIDTSKNRLNISTDSNDFLCKVDLNERWNTLNYPFLTEAGRTVEISYPKSPSSFKEQEIQNLVNQLESTILSQDNLNESTLIDLDSWVRKYLIDEISANVDSDHASSYFFFTNNQFYAGPIWDYDMTLGISYRNKEPNAFIARNENITNKHQSPYYSALYENESFYNRMVEIYRSEFIPLLNEFINSKINTFSDKISEASKMNSIRWEYLFEQQGIDANSERATSQTLGYLKARVEFLNSAWIDNVEYCIVQFETTPDEPYYNFSVKKGDLLEISSPDINLEDTVWINAETDEIFDPNKPILDNILLKPQHIEENTVSEIDNSSSSSQKHNINTHAILGSVFAISILFLIIVIIDIKRHRLLR